MTGASRGPLARHSPLPSVLAVTRGWFCSSLWAHLGLGLRETVKVRATETGGDRFGRLHTSSALLEHHRTVRVGASATCVTWLSPSESHVTHVPGCGLTVRVNRSRQRNADEREPVDAQDEGARDR